MHPDAWAQFLTPFGNLGVMLPLSAMVAIVVVAAAGWRMLVLWSSAILVPLALILVAKLFFIPCGYLFPDLAIHSPSGHAASAMAVYGGIAVLVGRMIGGRRTAAASLLLVMAIALALAIAVSRVVIGVHTLPEVILGSSIGLVSPIILAVGAHFPERKAIFRPWMVLLPLVPIVFLRGVDLPAEQIIDHAADWFAQRLGVCSGGQIATGASLVTADTAILLGLAVPRADN
jgi:membrane-associated phospholipid phosphatase